MGPTLDELHRRTRNLLSTTSTRKFTPEILTDLLNEAQDVISGEAPWALSTWFHTTVVAGSGRYALPPRAIHPTFVIIELSSGQQVRLKYETSDEMDDLARNGFSSTGTPDQIAYGKMLTRVYAELYPAPSTTYDGADMWIGCNVRAKTMVELTDRTQMPGRCVQALTLYAAWHVKIKDEEPAQADRLEKQFGSALESLAHSRMIEDADTFPTVAWAHGRNRRGI